MTRAQDEAFTHLLAGDYQRHTDRRALYEQHVAEYGVISIVDNFFCRLPAEPNDRTIGTNYRYIEALIRLDLDVPYSQQDPSLKPNEVDPENGYSELYLSLTPRQYYQIIDHTLTQRGITQERALEIRSQRRNGQLTSKQVNEILLPVFLDLVEMGFTYQDIGS